MMHLSYLFKYNVLGRINTSVFKKESFQEKTREWFSGRLNDEGCGMLRRTKRFPRTNSFLNLIFPSSSLPENQTMSLPSHSTPRKEADSPSLQAPSQRRLWSQEIIAPLRVRDFCLLFTGQMISTLGDMLYAVALPWLMLSTHHSPQELGIVLAAYGVPRVGTLLLGGVLSDHIGPSRVMLLSDGMRALLVGLMVVLVAFNDVDVVHLSILAALLGTFTGLFLPAYYALVPEILPEEALQAGNALNASTLQFALFLGSAIAGTVVSRLSSAVAFFLDACTFVISAFTLLLMHQKQYSVQEKSEQSAFEQASKDESRFAPDITFWELIRTWRLLQVALVVVVFGNFLFSGMFEVALPTLAHDRLAAGANGYGLLLAAFGAGSLLGGLGAGMLGRLAHRGMLMLVLIMGLACWYSLVPYIGGLPGAVFFIACAGLTNGLLTVLAFTLLQQQAPRHLLGRLMAILLFASLALYPISVAIAGVLTAHLGPVLLFPLSGAMMLVAALFGWSQSEVRKL
jgi:MFS family permease